jgi:hypothetical protein
MEKPLLAGTAQKILVPAKFGADRGKNRLKVPQCAACVLHRNHQHTFNSYVSNVELPRQALEELSSRRSTPRFAVAPFFPSVESFPQEFIQFKVGLGGALAEAAAELRVNLEIQRRG